MSDDTAPWWHSTDPKVRALAERLVHEDIDPQVLCTEECPRAITPDGLVTVLGSVPQRPLWTFYERTAREALEMAATIDEGPAEPSLPAPAEGLTWRQQRGLDYAPEQ